MTLQSGQTFRFNRTLPTGLDVTKIKGNFGGRGEEQRCLATIFGLFVPERELATLRRGCSYPQPLIELLSHFIRALSKQRSHFALTTMAWPRELHMATLSGQ